MQKLKYTKRYPEYRTFYAGRKRHVCLIFINLYINRNGYKLKHSFFTTSLNDFDLRPSAAISFKLFKISP